MSHKSEWSHHRLEVPHHDGTIEGARNGLPQIGIEHGRCHSIFVAFEAAFQGRVRHLAINDAAFVVASVGRISLELLLH